MKSDENSKQRYRDPVAATRSTLSEGTGRGAPPYTLDPRHVYSVYPPKGSSGMFGYVAPHVVFTRRTLPWERVNPASDTAPWLALLLFDEQENARLTTMLQQDAFLPDEDVYCPAKPFELEESCVVLDMDACLCLTLPPTLDEMPLLTHSRYMSRDDRAIDAGEDGWISMLVSNRRPNSNSEEMGMKNTACVAALDSFSDFFTNPDLREEIGAGKKYQTVRIPILYHWDFFSKQDNFVFPSVFGEIPMSPDKPCKKID